MITFKEFLAEAIVKSWETEKFGAKAGIDLLNKHCQDGLKAISNGGLLYRGFAKAPPGKVVFIDSTKAIRTSRDTTNTYQLMMDASSAFAGYPSRSRSLICSTNGSIAESYAGNSDAHVIIPFDGTVIASSKNADFIKTSYVNPFGADRMSGTEIEDIDSMFYNILKQLKAPTTKGQFISIKELDNHLSAIEPEIILHAVADVLRLYTRLYDDGEDDNIIELNDFFYEDTTSLLGKPVKRKKFVALFQKYASEFDSDIKSLYKKITALDPKRKFSGLSTIVMTPKTCKVSLHKFGEALPYNKEVWFSGKALAIQIGFFAEIVEELQKLGHPIDKAVKSEMRRIS